MICEATNIKDIATFSADYHAVHSSEAQTQGEGRPPAWHAEARSSHEVKVTTRRGDVESVQATSPESRSRETPGKRQSRRRHRRME